MGGKETDIGNILGILEQEYGQVESGLRFENPFQLLVAVILSAQCTDVRVNNVTKRLFANYKTPEDFASLSQEELEKEIRECGLFRNKAQNIRKTAAILQHELGCQVPSTREELMALPGVGRKSANVILSHAFGQDALAVDTHVFRVSHRLGLANGKTPLATEEQLLEIIPREKWSQAHQWLIRHGRRVCRARKPRCEVCILGEYCPRVLVFGEEGA